MGNRRAEILAATRWVIARDGLRGMRVENVAAEAGVSTTLLYYYFNDRAGLITNTMEYINARVGTYTHQAEGPTGYERLQAQLLCEFGDEEEVRENSAIWGEIRGASVFDDALRPIVESATSHWVSDLAGLIYSGQDDGSIDPTIDPTHLAIRLTALTEGLSNRWLSGLMSTDEARTHLTAALASEIPARARSAASRACR